MEVSKSHKSAMFASETESNSACLRIGDNCGTFKANVAARLDAGAAASLVLEAYFLSSSYRPPSDSL